MVTRSLGLRPVARSLDHRLSLRRRRLLDLRLLEAAQAGAAAT
jgi:hypothetical protein